MPRGGRFQDQCLVRWSARTTTNVVRWESLMKAALAALVALAMALSFTALARGDIRARAFVSISRVNIQGTFLPAINDVVDKTDATSADSGTISVDGETEIGSASMTASAFGSHAQKMIGLFVDGIAEITRPTQPPVIPVTGSITASAQAFVELKDELTFSFPAPLSDPAKISGYLNLTGDMSVAETEAGPSIGALANIGVSVTGTGITPTTDGLSTIDISEDPSFKESVSGLALFSYEVSAGVAKPITITMSLTGGVQIAGANFSVAQGAQARAEFLGDFSSSLDWGGITSVVNARTGQALAGWTVTSKSGFDYSQVFPPVPEPSSLAMLLTASAGGAARRQRRIGSVA